MGSEFCSFQFVCAPRELIQGCFDRRPLLLARTFFSSFSHRAVNLSSALSFWHFLVIGETFGTNT